MTNSTFKTLLAAPRVYSCVASCFVLVSVAKANIPQLSGHDLIAVTEQWRQQTSPDERFRGATNSTAEDFVAECRTAALAGDPNQQFQMGVFYQHGILVPQNFDEAYDWYSKSADQGLAIGEYAVGLMHVFDLAPHPDRKLGASYFKKAAEHGLDAGQFAWASCLQVGFGIETNLTEAVWWHRIAASNNYAPAQCALAAMYDEGVGVPQDNKEAIRFYRLAAAKNYPVAQHALGVSYAQGTGVEQNFREAARFYRLAAEQGYCFSAHNLGTAYMNGRGVERDIKEAARWLRLPAEHGVPESQFIYGLCFVMEEGIPMDEKEAVFWFKKAAEQNHPGAQAFLGRAYLDGAGIETNVPLAVKFIQTSAQAGYPEGLRCYAGLYAGGTGVARDVVEAYKWFTLAMRAGDNQAEGLRNRLAAEMTQAQVYEGILRASGFKPISPVFPASETRFYPQTQNQAARLQEVKGRILSYGIADKLPRKISVPFSDDPTGQYHIVQSGAIGFIETNQIPAKLGVSFGLSCEISGLQEHAGNAVEMETVWTYPPMNTPGGSNSGFSTIEPRIVRSGGRCWCLAGYAFEKEYELVPGKWRVEFRYRGKTIVVQEFNVIGN